MAAAPYHFSPLAAADLPLIRRWLAQPHVAQWWPHGDAELETIRGHINDAAIDPFLVHMHDRPIGYLQCYDPHAEAAHPFRDQPIGTRGIDQFIGEPELIDRGHGSGLTRTFVERLFAAGAPLVLTDPDPANTRAVRAYEKAGFQSDRLVDTPWGRTILMVRTA